MENEASLDRLVDTYSASDLAGDEPDTAASHRYPESAGRVIYKSDLDAIDAEHRSALDDFFNAFPAFENSNDPAVIGETTAALRHALIADLLDAGMEKSSITPMQHDIGRLMRIHGAGETARSRSVCH